ncbi:MAG: ABC transporter permease [Candidatus Eisenbacteria bacterium]|nr:ABC transporter permease [Candidatus Eisenbacteria bacterium]
MKGWRTLGRGSRHRRDLAARERNDPALDREVEPDGERAPGTSTRLRRALEAGVRSGAPAVLAVLAALCVGLFAAALLGVPPGRIFALLGERFGSYAFGQVLYKATFLIFTGLSVAIAFHAGLFNIGAEGQAVAGSLACAAAGIALAGAPGFLQLLGALGAAFAGGALWGALPGWLKARWGSHEVINTIMLNFIALALANFVVTRFLGLPETVRTAEIGAGAALPRLDGLFPSMRGSAANASLVVACAAAIAAHLLLRHTRFGLTLRAVGRGRRQAEILGIDAGSRIVLAFLIAGGLAGLVGANFVLGYKHYYEDGFTGGIGFVGIAVALLARNEPLAVLPVALLFGLLSQAGLIVNTLLPREVVDSLTGLILLFFIAAQRWRRTERAAPASAPGSLGGTA